MADASELLRAAARAVPLNARGRVPEGLDREGAGDEERTERADRAARADRADRKLERWRAQAPFDRAD